MSSDQNNENTNSLNILGLKPVGDAIKLTMEKSFEAAEAILSRICLPVAEEFGLMLQDKVRYWRLKNMVKIIEKTEGKLEFREDKLELKAHPRVVNSILENASWQENEKIQDLWAGLLASSCSKNHINDDNIIYIEILKQLTPSEAAIINYWSQQSEIEIDDAGIARPDKGILMSAKEFFQIVNTEDLDKLNSEINHLKGLDLIEEGLGLASGFFYREGNPELQMGLKISPLALNLYVKGHGHCGSVKTYLESVK